METTVSCAGLCDSVFRNAASDAGERIRSFWQLLHALFRYVPPVLSLLCRFPQGAAQRRGGALYLERWDGYGLLGAHFLLPGVSAEPAQCSGSRRNGAGILLPADASETGICGIVFCAVSQRDFSEE